MTKPLISVIIPVFNGEKYLGEAVDSILAQAHRPLEVIIVDDGSTDGTAAVAQRFACVRYIRQVNRGAAAARNHGIQLAAGDLFAFLDADDLWMPDRISRQLAVLEADATIDGVLGCVQQFFSPDLEMEARARIKCPAEPQPGTHVGALLIRREAFHRVGPFDETRPIAEVIDWMSRVRDAGVRLHMLPDVVFRRRLHGNNQGLKNHHHRKMYTHVAKAALDRKRRAAAAVSESCK